MPRFVILEHDFPTCHWDFFLEAGSILRAWRLLDTPSVGGTCRAEQSPDHRRHYLDFEGPVSGGRGNVRRIDVGTYTRGSREADLVEFWLEGSQFGERASFVRAGDGWTCQFKLRE